MRVEDINTLIETMSKNGLSLLEWETEGNRLRLERPADTTGHSAAVHSGDNMPAEPKTETALEEVTIPEGDLITAPVVGIFYASPSPDSDPFVKVGSVVEEGSTLCIIEAMKLMNEVTSSRAGIVREIMVEDGQKVEFGQPLMRIGGNVDVAQPG